MNASDLDLYLDGSTSTSTCTMLRSLYLANATLLVVHELDSVFWREWELFRLPGGEAGSSPRTSLLAGRPEFRAPASIAVLAGSLVVSLAQGPGAAAALRAPRPAPDRATSSGRTSP